MFIMLLASLVNGSNHIKCMSFSNQKYITRPTPINLLPTEYSQELLCYSFVVKLDRCAGNYNTLNVLSNKVCVPNKIADLNLSVFKMITGENESKILTKDISCKCKYKFNGRKCNSDEKWNNDKCQCKCKKHCICEKVYIWNLATCSCKNCKYFARIIDDSVITCDEIIDAEAKRVPTNFNEKSYNW